MELERYFSMNWFDVGSLGTPHTHVLKMVSDTHTVHGNLSLGDLVCVFV